MILRTDCRNFIENFEVQKFYRISLIFEWPMYTCTRGVQKVLSLTQKEINLI